MSKITRKGAEQVLGALNDRTYSAIEATGANISDVTEAKWIMDGTNDIAGQGERALSGPVKEILIIVADRMDENRLRTALLDPPSVFQSPADVLADQTRPKSQKIEILRRWEYDACEISVAEEEGMPAQNGEMLQQILQALHELGVNVDTDKTPPTKQGGLGRAALKQRE